MLAAAAGEEREESLEEEEEEPDALLRDVSTGKKAREAAQKKKKNGEKAQERGEAAEGSITGGATARGLEKDAAKVALASFKELKLCLPLLKAVQELGFKAPTPIQVTAVLKSLVPNMRGQGCAQGLFTHPLTPCSPARLVAGGGHPTCAARGGHLRVRRHWLRSGASSPVLSHLGWRPTWRQCLQPRQAPQPLLGGARLLTRCAPPIRRQDGCLHAPNPRAPALPLAARAGDACVGALPHA